MFPIETCILSTCTVAGVCVVQIYICVYFPNWQEKLCYPSKNYMYANDIILFCSCFFTTRLEFHSLCAIFYVYSVYYIFVLKVAWLCGCTCLWATVLYFTFVHPDPSYSYYVYMYFSCDSVFFCPLIGQINNNHDSKNHWQIKLNVRYMYLKLSSSSHKMYTTYLCFLLSNILP